MSAKIRQSHLQRQAFVYLRQSSQGQVEFHKESTERQYALADRAGVLGWDKSQVCVLDADLGKSGTTVEGRNDFSKLMAAVGLGQAGAVFALEVSRFSRSQADWHRLLDVCALSDTLIVDHDGIYDPNDFNDRVLLGFKGTWSHTELHGMKLRLQGAKLNKAKKGELRCRYPAGYVYDTNGKLVIDPDEGVVAAVKLVFKKFRELGTGLAVARYFATQKLLFPLREWGFAREDVILWRPLTHCRVLSIVKNPTYAGVYSYGRSRTTKRILDGNIYCGRSLVADRNDWTTVIRDAHCAYVTWEEFLENEKQLSRNRLNVDSDGRRGAARNGDALLQGLVICGKCGTRMNPRFYGKSNQQSVYVCARGQSTFGTGHCWVVSCSPVDKAVESHLLSQLTNENVDISLSVLLEVEKGLSEERRHWDLRVERARIEAERARRQYDRVEPENRLVARTLEAKWNDALAEVEKIEQEFADARRKVPLELTAEQRQKVLRLARDLPQLWHANTTENRDRKELLSLLIKQVSIAPIDIPERQTQIDILWHTGATTQIFSKRLLYGSTTATPPEVLDAIRKIDNMNDKNIARELNKQGLRSGLGKAFTGPSVSYIRRRYNITKLGSDSGFAGKGELFEGKYLSKSATAKRLGVGLQTVLYWQQTGLLKGIQKSPNGPWWFELTEKTIKDLQPRIKQYKSRKKSQQGHMENTAQ